MFDRFRQPIWFAGQPHFDLPLVVFQSDDWGQPCVAERQQLARLCPAALAAEASAWWRDARESVADVEALAAVLSGFHDGAGNSPCFTINFIVREPDYEAIEASAFGRYSSRPIRHGEVVGALTGSKLAAALFEPALHGAEHVAPARWLSLIRAGAADLRAFFAARVMPPSALISRYRGLGAPYLPCPDDQADIAGPGERLDDALATFEHLFGQPAQGFVAPNHAWDAAVEEKLARGGIAFMQAAHVQYPDWAAVEAGNWRSNGPRASGIAPLWYQTRTVDFEPVIRPGTTAAEIRRACLLLRRGIPVVVNTHRINYAGGVQPGAVERARQDLARLIGALLQERPDLRFVRSAELDQVLRGRHPAVRRRRLAPVANALLDVGRAFRDRGKKVPE